MFNDNDSFGCLWKVLFLMVIAASFGFVEWGTVGRFTKYLVYLSLGGIAIMVIVYLVFGRENTDNESR